MRVVACLGFIFDMRSSNRNAAFALFRGIINIIKCLNITTVLALKILVSAAVNVVLPWST